MPGAFYSSTTQHAVGPVFRELLAARELLWDLVAKDLRVRYRYAAVGFLWAVLEPLALMGMLVFVFQVVFRARTDMVRGDLDIPYALVILTGLVFWQFTAGVLNSATTSLVGNQHLLTKVRFPREVIPLATVGQAAVMLGIALVLLAIAATALGLYPSLAWLWVLPLFALQALLTIGLALLLSALHVRYRDIGHIVAVVVTLGFYASPVFYPLSFVRESTAFPSWLVTLYLANPMAELLAGYRQALLEARTPEGWLFVWPAVCAGVLLVAGVVVFRRAAPTIADHV